MNIVDNYPSVRTNKVLNFNQQNNSIYSSKANSDINNKTPKIFGIEYKKTSAVSPFILKELRVKNEKEYFPNINIVENKLKIKTNNNLKYDYLSADKHNNNKHKHEVGLNDKIKTASEYYKNYCISKIDNKLASSNDDIKSKNSENKSHVSSYIKNFMDETYEIPKIKGKLDKDKECRIQFKSK